MSRLLFALMAAMLLIGCDSPPPPVSPDAVNSNAGSAALSAYDKNSDGLLDATELEACVALKSAVSRIDKNSDGKLSAAEIDARIQAWRSANMGRITATAEVLQAGKPLTGAEVRLVPEKFQGDSLLIAKGTTSEIGSAPLNVADSVGGVSPGFFRVEIIATPPLPEKYHAQSILGVEIAPDSPALMPGGLKFELE